MLLTENSIRYTLSHLARVAFPSLNTSYFIDNKEISIQIEGIKITFFIMGEDTVSELLTGNLSMKKVDVTRDIKVPMYADPSSETLYSVENQQITLHCDLLTLPFILLSRWEECQPEAARDAHGRFQYAGSMNEKYDLMDVPLADGYAMLLRQWVTAEFPDFQPGKREPQCISTHDIDILTRFGDRIKNCRTLAADLLKYRSRKLFRLSKKQHRAYKKDFRSDPYIEACKMLLNTDLTHRWQSIFFIKPQIPNEYDCTYDIFGKEISYFIDYLKDKKAVIGLHSGYHAAFDEAIFSTEKERLEKATGKAVTLNRQHYLRFNHQQTLRYWQSAGVTDDYTLGFAEREGFRCGTCHPYPLYDIANNCATTIIEHPLVAMDMTFIQYRKWTPEESQTKVSQLVKTCQQMEGDFVLLWHNTTVWRQYRAWYEKVFVYLG